MIKVLKLEDEIKLTGHSDYDELGKDIVCSAVSSIMITTVNAISKFNKKAISYERSNDTSIIKINEKDDITLNLIDNMMELLVELSKKYPKNIIVKER
jgi:uncharacterized protein YsxB (DUF464 family)